MSVHLRELSIGEVVKQCHNLDGIGKDVKLSIAGPIVPGRTRGIETAELDTEAIPYDILDKKLERLDSVTVV
jgi:hypothetical protein